MGKYHYITVHLSLQSFYVRFLSKFSLSKKAEINDLLMRYHIGTLCHKPGMLLSNEPLSYH